MENDLNHFFDLSSDMLCMVDLKGNFRKINRAFTSMLGYEEADLLHLSYFGFVHSDDLLSTKKIWRALKAQEQPFYFENHCKTKQGTWRRLAWTVHPDTQKGIAYCMAKQAEAAYQDSSRQEVNLTKVDGVLETMPDAFIVLDENWIVRYWNTQSEHLLGVEKTEVLGKSIFEIYPEEKGRVFHGWYEQAIRTGSPVHFEEKFERIDRWLQVAAYPSNGGVALYVRDIDQRKKKESELEKVSERYRLLAKANASTTWEWNAEDNRTRYHDENFRKLFGYDIAGDALSFEYWTEHILHPEDRTRVFAEMERTLAGNGNIWASEYRMKKADGDWAYIRARAYMLRDEQGKLMRMVGSSEDITTQKVSEIALIESEKSYRKLFHNALLPQIIYDAATFRIMKVNEAAIRHYGYSREEFLQMDALDTRFQAELTRLMDYVAVLKEDETNLKEVWTHVKKNGERIFIDSTAVPILCDGREAVLVTFQDITEKRMLEQKITTLKLAEQKKITRAQIRGQEKERMQIGMELHDNINQLLASAKLFLNVARTDEELRGEMIAESEELVHKAMDEIRHLSQTLTSPTLHKQGLPQALREMVECFRAHKGLSIDLTCSTINPALPEETALTLFRIAQEALVNIVKHAAAVQVRISLEKRGNCIELVIRDDGKGFEPDHKKIGVGLSNMKSRADLLNGIMTVYSAPGCGCTIAVQIPTAPCSGKPYRVVAVEGDVAGQRIFREAFSEAVPQHTLIFSRNVQQAVELLYFLPERDLPGLIILDCPWQNECDMKALHVLEESQRLKKIPKIIYSKTKPAGYRPLAAAAGGTVYLHKREGCRELQEDIRQMILFSAGARR